MQLYRLYDRDPALLDEAERLCQEVRRRRPTYAGFFKPLSTLAMHRNNYAEAEWLAKEWIAAEPDNYASHFALGFLYMDIGESEKAIPCFEASLEIKPDNMATLWNMIIVCNQAREFEKRSEWAAVALPYEERHVKLHPDDEISHVNIANLLYWVGKEAEARELAKKSVPKLRDGGALFTMSCLFIDFGDRAEALRTFRKCIEAGFSHVYHLKNFLNDEKERPGMVVAPEEFAELEAMIDVIEQKASGAAAT